MARTTLNLDETALDAAMEPSPGRTKTEVINAALRDDAKNHAAAEGLLAVRGKLKWEGDLDALRGRAS